MTRAPETPCLLGMVGTLAGRRLPLQGKRLVLGRDRSRCQLVLDHAVISREHAAFDIEDDGTVSICDLNSTQGTFVNGAPVSSTSLRDGDLVGFGRNGVVAFRFEYRSDVPVMPPVVHHPPPVAEPRPAKTEQAPASQRVKRIGRAPDNDIVLASAAVSRYHATLTFGDSGVVIADAGSTNGTFVNGQTIAASPLTANDLVYIAGFLLKLSGSEVVLYDLSSSRIVAAGIDQTFGDRRILHDVSFAILPREFVGLMGPSGCGKSTLMDALNGLRPASGGSVSIDDLDLYGNFDAVRRSIGCVPQRDVLHDALSVERTLHYAAQLRLPENTPAADRQRIIDETVATVGLSEHRQTRFDRLSGGQQKRLSLAVELLTKPSFLYLDEPTSPLDPETSENLMLLFRKLADEGRIVVMVTHKFEKFDEMHQIALLTKGGRLAFFGPPREALKYFGCTEPSDIYRNIASREPDEVARAFQNSPYYAANVTSRLKESREAMSIASRMPLRVPQERPGLQARAAIRQWTILTRRYAETKLRDRRNTALLIVQAPVIAWILAVIAGNTVNDSKTLFILSIIAIWFGANNAAREIVADFAVYRRERLVSLKIPPYLLSKFTVLGAIGVTQCALLFLTLAGLDRLRPADVSTLLPTLCLTTFAGTALGLLFSAWVNTTEKAMSVLPLLLIPQLLLSGFLKPIDDVYFNARTGAPATAAQHDAFTAASSGRRAADAAVAADPISKIEGLGSARIVADAMVAKWSVDALVHGVGANDRESRARLASQIAVAGYRSVHDGSPESQIAATYRRHVRVDWLVLIATTALYLGIAGGVLRLKDSV